MKNVNKLLLKDALKELMKEKKIAAVVEDGGESNSEGLKSLMAKLKDEPVAVKDKVVMKKDDYDKEHEDLVKTLKEKDPKKLDKEAKAQADEKDAVDNEDDSPTDAKAFLKVAMLLMKKKK